MHPASSVAPWAIRKAEEGKHKGGYRPAASHHLTTQQVDDVQGKHDLTVAA